jgi:hypothetical protein
MLLEGMFLVIFGIIMTSVAAFARHNAVNLRAKRRRILPMDKFDLAPAVHPLSEVIEHTEAPDDPRAYGSEQMQRGAALRRVPRHAGPVRAV